MTVHAPGSGITRPDVSEHAAFYAGYVGRVPDGDPVARLLTDLAEARAFYAAIDDGRAARPYAPGKWTVKDVLLHVADTERVMAYRALRALRGDATPLPGFEQDDWQRVGAANGRSMDDLLVEIVAVRHATLALFGGVDDAAARRAARANGAPVTARALLYIVLGHERHHRHGLAGHGFGAEPAARSSGGASMVSPWLSAIARQRSASSSRRLVVKSRRRRAARRSPSNRAYS